MVSNYDAGTAEARSGVTTGEQDISAEENRQRRYEIIRRHLFSFPKGLNLAQIKLRTAVGRPGKTTIPCVVAVWVIAGYQRFLLCVHDEYKNGGQVCFYSRHMR